MLDIWPALPIVISARQPLPASGVINIISVLQQYNRVCATYIHRVPNPLLNEFAAIQGPFPALTELWLWSIDKNAAVLPDSFLGGAAPRLQDLTLSRVSTVGAMLMSSKRNKRN